MPTKLGCLSFLLNLSLALSSNVSSSLKRRYEQTSFDDVDSENMDPSLLSSTNKKNKTGLEDFSQPRKGSQYTLTNTLNKPSARPIKPLRSTASRAVGPQKRHLLSTPIGKSTLPTARHIESAPAAARRSPKSKRYGILSRRRTSIPYTRVDPPTSLSNGAQDSLSFGIDAALNGTISSYKVESAKVQETRALDESIRTSWMFDIHEDTLQEELGNLIQHSTCTLDISDDESRSAAKEDRGKENVPPMDSTAAAITIPVSMPASRKNLMTDEPRTPLGDLEATEFYAEGCDVNSYIIIPAEQETERSAENAQCATESSTEPQTTPILEPDCYWKDLLAQVAAAKGSHATFSSSLSYIQEESADVEAPGIEIWESESAKAEDASVRGDSPAPIGPYDEHIGQN